MPKKHVKSRQFGPSNRGGRPGNNDDPHYFGHDDRVRQDQRPKFTTRSRVSFKPQRLARDIRLSFDDDTVMASSSNNNNRQVVLSGERGMSRGRNSPLPHRGFRPGIIPPGGGRIRHFAMGELNWFKITIPHGQKYEKDYILRNLMSYIAPETFVPILYRVIGHEASFYVDDHKIANALNSCDRKITASDGFKLGVRVKPGVPHSEIDDKLKEKLKQAMAKRYVAETNALDLSKFHQDPDLAAEYFCALFRPIMLRTVLDIVLEHIPTLEALNLEGNKLQVLVALNTLHKKFTKLRILYLGDNKIREINQLDNIKSLKLEELRLAGNPICNKYKTRQTEYISDVRKRFPKLLRLDNVELPKPIVFDVIDEGSKIPPSRRLFVANAKAQEIASQFLQQYFLVFDSGNRQPLLDAYDEHACFSMTISYPQNASKLNGYLLENRNLYRIIDNNKRQKLLKQGRLPVVSFISEMPRTSHYLNSFTMDVSLVTEGMMLVTVTGLFKELDKDQGVRYFNRTFIIVPEGSGYCIRNEQLHLNQPTDAQLKQLLNNPPSEASMSEATIAGPSPQTIVKPSPAQLPEDVKQQMTVTLSQQTNMNLEWSLKCLEEVQWNYDNALAAFQEFFKRGQIPPEAFNK